MRARGKAAAAVLDSASWPATTKKETMATQSAAHFRMPFDLLPSCLAATDGSEPRICQQCAVELTGECSLPSPTDRRRASVTIVLVWDNNKLSECLLSSHNECDDRESQEVIATNYPLSIEQQTNCRARGRGATIFSANMNRADGWKSLPLNAIIKRACTSILANGKLGASESFHLVLPCKTVGEIKDEHKSLVRD